MAHERSGKKRGICSRLKAAFRSEKGKQSESSMSLQTSANARPGSTTLQTDRNERPGSTIVSNDQSNLESNPDEDALEETTSQIDGDKRPGSTIVSNDLSNLVSNPDGNTVEEDISTKLWSVAYENMRDGDKKELIITYEKVLTKVASDGKSLDVDEDPNQFENCDRQTRIILMRSTVDQIIEKTKEHSKARGYVIQGVTVFNEIKDIISSALTSYPPAALAFSGLCAALPVRSIVSIVEEV